MSACYLHFQKLLDPSTFLPFQNPQLSPTPAGKTSATPDCLMSLSSVLQVPELLELILFHLDNRTILHAMRVSCNFKTIITTSPTLQSKLFLLPEPRDSTPTINSTLSKATITHDSLPLFSQPIHYICGFRDGEYGALPTYQTEASYAMFLIKTKPHNASMKEEVEEANMYLGS